MKAFLQRKNIEISLKRYGIDALSAMAQGLFCSFLIGTILNTLGQRLGISALTRVVATIGGVDYTVGAMASAMSGPAMATAIAYALQAPPLVLFSLITVGFASNALGGAGDHWRYFLWRFFPQKSVKRFPRKQKWIFW